MALAAALAALEDDAHVQRTCRVSAEGLDFFEQAFDEMGLPFVPSATNFILVETGKGKATFKALQREQVIVRPMSVYGLPSHIRITVGTRKENEKCLCALKKVLNTRNRAT